MIHGFDATRALRDDERLPTAGTLSSLACMLLAHTDTFVAVGAAEVELGIGRHGNLRQGLTFEFTGLAADGVNVEKPVTIIEGTDVENRKPSQFPWNDLLGTLANGSKHSLQSLLISSDLFE